MNTEARTAIRIAPFLGACLGALVAADAYLFRWVPYSFTSRLLQRFPYKTTALVFLLLAAAIVFLRSANLLSRLPFDRCFSLFLIVGYHTAGAIKGSLNPSSLALMAILLLWSVRVFVRGGYRILTTPLLALNIILLIFGFLSQLAGGGIPVSAYFPMFKNLLMAFLLVDILKTRESLNFFLKTLVIVTALSAAFGIFQEAVYLFNGIILAPVDIKYLRLMIQKTWFGPMLRVPALTGMHLFLSCHLMVGLILIFNNAYYLDAEAPKWKTRFAVFAFAVIPLALLLTFVKTTIAGAAGGILLSSLIGIRRKRWHFLALTCGFLVCLIASVEGLADYIFRYVRSDAELVGDIGLRLNLAKDGIEGFLQSHPILGTGLRRGGDYTANVWGWQAHNSFILAADEVGLPGLLSFVALFLYIFVRLLNTFPGVTCPRDRALLASLTGAFVAYFLHIQFQPDFLSYYNWFLLGLIESAVVVIRRGRADSSAPEIPLEGGSRS